MSETLDILTETVGRLFADEGGDDAARRARNRGGIDELWAAVSDLGLPLGLLTEEQGGFGLCAEEVLPMLRIAARHGAPVPLAETMLANWVLANSNLPVAPGMATIAMAATGAVQAQETGFRLSGQATFVPWGGEAATIVVVTPDKVVSVRRDEVSASPAGDGNQLPRADLAFDAVVEADRIAVRPAGLNELVLRSAGALCRALEIAGAAGAILDTTVGYANERVQFGRPLGKFQAIQQQLAILAGEVAAANAACDLAVSAWTGTVEPMVAAIAKVRAGEAAGTVASIAHQVLGAIGFTQEHRLQIFTRSLWMWRDEFGTEREWNRFLGASALAGRGSLWSWVTGKGLLGDAA